jgi:hypothetical protein
MKYKLKLDYTVDELKELKELSNYNSPMDAIIRVARADAVSEPFRKLMLKLPSIAVDEEFDFMADINNVVMGTAIFPDKLYIIHDTNTNCVIYHDDINNKLDWGPLTFYRPVKNTKSEWLAINPAYESMLVEVEE